MRLPVNDTSRMVCNSSRPAIGFIASHTPVRWCRRHLCQWTRSSACAIV